MNAKIFNVICSLCEDIKNSSNAEEKMKKVEAIEVLTAYDRLLPILENLTSITCNIILPPVTKAVLTAYKTADRGKAKSSKIPNPGEHFNYNGIDHIILGEEQGGLLAIRAEALDEEKPFDKGNENDWRICSLRVDLNENEIKNYNKGDLLPFVSDLTADNGDKSYGTCKDYIFILSCDLIRKYRDLLPKYKTDDIVTLTPWACGTIAYRVRFLGSSGYLGYSVASSSYGVAPACLFNPSIFE